MTAQPTAVPARPKAKSRATRAAAKMPAPPARPNLTIVPDPQPDPEPEHVDNPGTTNPKSAIDAITARLASAVGAGGLPPSVIQRASGTSSARPATGENLNPDGTRKGTAQAKAAAATAKAATSAAAKARVQGATRQKAATVRAAKLNKKVPDATASAVAHDRYNGIVTVTTPGATKRAKPTVETFNCEHAARNGHITTTAAIGCAQKLLRNHPEGVTGTAKRDRYLGQYKANAEGSTPVTCSCKFGHKTAESAIECAKQQAAKAGLLAA